MFNLLNDVCKTFSNQMKQEHEFYKKSEIEKQKKGEFNMLDIKAELKANLDTFKKNNNIK